MDLFPNLGEPGIYDELFYCGPVGVLAVLFGIFFWFMSRWDPESNWVGRGIAAAGLTLLSASFLLILFCILYSALLANSAPPGG